MVRADIIISVKNAVERGYSIEQAKQSLANSGYSMKEIADAVNYLTSGVGTIELPNQANYLPERVAQTNQQTNAQNQQPHGQAQQMPPSLENVQQEQFKIPKQKGPFPWKIIIPVILLLILVAVLVGMIMFKDVIIETLQKLLVG
ncbi:hypothetical protein COU56_04675 [Candidatus Pacearchaeota archaeon CG10_big_fil_rev_8_21_14_0_10_31_9]|nr:MAG: hypothetical protein AUJ62_02890 [Candidatus Pacearchaeota archaeon CG1_02_32_21]PIN91764.1 MAG: hypothetical protein COU56_04675 [Candidatus Pacearchaeota archaeon CG10_big_fil_rev_8_21_14_0_10_31_9]PIZ83768.1 MAG: hypothetical protein COX97_00485 [Candidatus Pacearchaeota archaeon CG_4_10_14_0_2_um_filter_05_32_18]